MRSSWWPTRWWSATREAVRGQLRTVLSQAHAGAHPHTATSASSVVTVSSALMLCSQRIASASRELVDDVPQPQRPGLGGLGIRAGGPRSPVFRLRPPSARRRPAPGRRRSTSTFSRLSFFKRLGVVRLRPAIRAPRLQRLPPPRSSLRQHPVGLGQLAYYLLRRMLASWPRRPPEPASRADTILTNTGPSWKRREGSAALCGQVIAQIGVQLVDRRQRPLTYGGGGLPRRRQELWPI